MATKAEILRKLKMTEQEFYSKYPTQEHYTKEFGNGGTLKKKYFADGGSTDRPVNNPNTQQGQNMNNVNNTMSSTAQQGGSKDRLQAADMSKLGEVFNSLTSMSNTTPAPTNPNSSTGYYDKQISRDSAMLSTGLSTVGTLIGGPVGGMVGKGISTLFPNGGQTQPTENLVEAGETVLTKDGKLVVYPDNGLTHEKNPNDGFKAPNEGYVFSNRLTMGNKSYADISKKIDKRYSLRKDDNISKEAKARELNDLMNHQEELRMNNNMTQANKNLKSYFKKGGKLFDGGGGLSKNPYITKNPIYAEDTVKPDFVDLPSSINTKVDPIITFDQGALNLNPNDELSMQDIPVPVQQSQEFITGLEKDAFGKNKDFQNRKYPYSPNQEDTNPANKPLFNSKYNPLGYAQVAGSAFDIAKGLFDNKNINYKPYKPTLMNDPYTPTNLRREAANALNSVNSDINTSGLNAGQAITTKINAATTNQGVLANQLSANKQQMNTYNNTLTNTGNQSAAETDNRNIDANELVQDQRANAVKTGLDTAGHGLATVGKDKDLYKSNDLFNNTMATFSNDMFSRYGLEPELDDKGNVKGFKSTFKKLSYGGKLMKKC